MKTPVPTAGSSLRRLIAIAGGAGILFWLRLEDNSAVPAALIAWLVSIWLIADRVLHWFGGQGLTAVGWTALMSLTGAACGAGAALAAAVLMLLKNGLHSHVVPDFPFSMISGMLARLPAWSAAGLLAGAGLALIALALRPAARPASPDRSP
jgi:hypothetical protein